MRRLLQYAVGLLAFVALPAMAADGFVTGNVNLRAGPDAAYPIITVVPLGTNVSIQGCTEGWGWCDVVTMGTRGWVAADYIQYVYQDQRVVVQDNGARIGIPIVSFVIGTYWGSYYRDRPFYRQRDYWFHRPIVIRPPHRPIHRPPVRPRPPGWSGGHRPGPGNGWSGGTRPKPQPGNGSGGGTRPPRPGNGSGGGTRPKPQTRPAPTPTQSSGN
ncbi:SH3 domain-containing protein [Dyella subtropica]|uniref:SH3 domain-containing protein n=1 Tax=Dyella subtropica TaxID=2992127 RepID=UPI00225102D4|nr:SH3 domain-containing protein [Dyella subtropica]